MKKWSIRISLVIIFFSCLIFTNISNIKALDDKITINFRVYDESNGNVYNVGSEEIQKLESSTIQYHLPSLSSILVLLRHMEELLKL